MLFTLVSLACIAVAKDLESLRSDAVFGALGNIESGDTGHLFAGGASGVKLAAFKLKPLTDAEIRTAGVGESFANDPTAGTWLPLANGQPPNLHPLSRPTGERQGEGRMRPLVCWYNGRRLAATRTFSNGVLQTAASKWTCAMSTPRHAMHASYTDYDIAFRLQEGTVSEAGVAVAFDFAHWSTNNDVLIPASVYNGNKQWLEKSRNLTNLVATWTVSYDYELPKTTELGRLGAKLAGVYWASTQNKHGAPGIYLRTDADRCYVFDSVEGEVVRRDTTGVTVRIHNPTQFDAQVSIFAETGEQAEKPQGDTAFLKWPKVNVPAGGAKEIRITKSGDIFTGCSGRVQFATACHRAPS